MQDSNINHLRIIHIRLKARKNPNYPHDQGSKAQVWADVVVLCGHADREEPERQASQHQQPINYAAGHGVDMESPSILQTETKLFSERVLKALFICLSFLPDALPVCCAFQPLPKRQKMSVCA